VLLDYSMISNRSRCRSASRWRASSRTNRRTCSDAECASNAASDLNRS